MTSVKAHLKMTVGPRAGSSFPLRPEQENLIGRGLDCDVILTDAQCSRVHAIVYRKDDGWWVRDAESRNGTHVNGQKIDDAQLAEGHLLKVGSTVFTFQSGEQSSSRDPGMTQTIVNNEKVDPDDTGDFSIAALRDSEQAHDFLMLYQLSIKLLGCDNPNDVVQTSLELLHERTEASVVGFLWTSDDGQLKPQLVIPEDAAGKVTLSQSLTELVIREGHAVRIDNQSPQSPSASIRDYADTICVPLIHDEQTVGAIHLYRDRGSFGVSDFSVSKSLANILVLALMRARRQVSLEIQHQRLALKSADTDELIGDSTPMQELKSKITRVARATGCVLVRGESGSGKELVARALHKTSPRADRPMLSVNCAAIPSELMESQLFGHKRGAFTGAENDHIGWFEQADTGTLFLDEVGELTLAGQAKLLRILEGHPFLPVGGSKEISADVRVIAATNRDLREFVTEKRFREDMYYRLSVFELYIPPLRDRGTDIELLLYHFLDHFKAQHGRTNLLLSDEVRHKLLGYPWPGNVRQLRNVVDSAVVMAEGDTIQLEDIGLRDTKGGDELDSLRIDFWERKLIKEALKRTGGSVPEAAKLVGLGRATLYRKIDEYEIER